MTYCLAPEKSIYPTNNSISIKKSIRKIRSTKMAMGLKNAPINIRLED
jgi:hypothetical protein